MDIKSILSKVDHTLLSQTATWEEIKQICDLAHSRNAIVKVILETCYLTDAQKKRCCITQSR